VLPCSKKFAAENSGRPSKSFVKEIWLRGRDLNPRPSGYEPDELPGCSTPHFENNFDVAVVQIEKRSSGEIAILFAFAVACDSVDA
jgi:hypothetical protein